LAATAALLRSGTPLAVDAVAKAAGVTRVTVYNQFGSRRGLLEAAFDRFAQEAGITRLADAFALSDPQAAIAMLVTVFCDFWAYDGGVAQRVHGAALADPEFAESVRDRNERRRHVLAALVGRLAERGKVSGGAEHDLVDAIFVLTSWPVYESLALRGRTPREVNALLQAMVDDLLRRARRGALPRSP
jgi:AcrR family transcriptional regulator